MSESLIGTLPGDWTQSTLGQLCDAGGGSVQTGPFGSQLHASDYVPVGIPTVMPTNIGDNRIIKEGIARIRLTDAERLSRYRLRTGDIVYSRRGDVERRALVRAAEHGWLCGTGSLRVRVGDGADSTWLSYYLGHPEVRAWIVRHAVGATMANLNSAILSALPVAVPPSDVQRAIARILGLLDDAIEGNHNTVATLSGLITATWQQSFASENDCPMLPIGDVALVVGGSTPRTNVEEFWGGTLAWATPKDLSRLPSVPLLETERCITELGLQQISSGLLPAGTVLLSSRAPIGYLAIAEVPVAVNQGFIALVASERLSNLYLWQWLKTHLDEVKSRANGTTFLEISKANFRPMPIPVPPEHMVRSWTESANTQYRLIVAKERESRALARLRDLVLPKLLSGEIRIRGAQTLVGVAV